jgi:hypothetical protein
MEIGRQKAAAIVKDYTYGLRGEISPLWNWKELVYIILDEQVDENLHIFENGYIAQ